MFYFLSLITAIFYNLLILIIYSGLVKGYFCDTARLQPLDYAAILVYELCNRGKQLKKGQK